MEQKRKPTFRDLRDRHHFSISQVKGFTDLPELTIYHMLMNVPIKKEAAIRILERITAITKIAYTLENVAVALLPDDEQPTEAGKMAEERPLPTFQQVRRQHQITLHMLIEDTQLDPAEVLQVDTLGIGTEATIELLLEALSRMAGQRYTRQNVDFAT